MSLKNIVIVTNVTVFNSQKQQKLTSKWVTSTNKNHIVKMKYEHIIENLLYIHKKLDKMFATGFKRSPET